MRGAGGDGKLLMSRVTESWDGRREGPPGSKKAGIPVDGESAEGDAEVGEELISLTLGILVLRR